MTMHDTPAPATTPTPLVAYLDGLVDQLRQHVAAAVQDGVEDSIHQARVATRRLKAASDLLRPILPNRSRQRWNRLLRRIRQRLGALRDIDVMLGHVAELSTDASSAGGEWLRARLGEDRAALLTAAQAAKVFSRLDERLSVWQRLRVQIDRHADAIDPLISASLHQQIADFATRAAGLEAPAAGADPHAVRIAGKALRYTVEMGVVQGHPLDESIARTFKKMQDALGLWHDYVVLADQAMTRATEEMLAHHDGVALRGVLALGIEASERADGRLDKFRNLWREDGPAVVQAIEQAFPLSRAVDVTATPSQTDPDHSGSAAPEAMDGPH